MVDRKYIILVAVIFFGFFIFLIFSGRIQPTGREPKFLHGIGPSMNRQDNPFAAVITFFAVVIVIGRGLWVYRKTGRDD